MEAHGELIPVGGGDAIALGMARCTVGRRDSCDIVLPFSNISGTHCELSFADGYWFVRDFGSTNGTKVNGERIRWRQPRKVLSGDQIAFARHRYVIRYDHDPNEPVGLPEPA